MSHGAAVSLIETLRGFSISALIWLTLPGDGRRANRRNLGETSGTGFGLMLNEVVKPTAARCNGAEQRAEIAVRKWCFVGASYDASNGTITLHQDLLADRTMTVASSVMRQVQASDVAPALMFAAWHLADSDGRPVGYRWSEAASTAKSSGRAWRSRPGPWRCWH